MVIIPTRAGGVEVSRVQAPLAMIPDNVPVETFNTLLRMCPDLRLTFFAVGHAMADRSALRYGRVNGNTTHR